jgi:hypothetical protein
VVSALCIARYLGAQNASGCGMVGIAVNLDSNTLLYRGDQRACVWAVMGTSTSHELCAEVWDGGGWWEQGF